MRKVIASFVLLLALAAAIGIAEADISLSREFLNLFTFILWLVATSVLAVCLPKGYGSIGFLYFLCFSVFHLGMVVATLFSAISDVELLSYVDIWFYDERADYAIKLSNIGCAALALGIIAFSTASQEQFREMPYSGQAKRIVQLGGGMLIVAIGSFLALLGSVGALTSYGAYLLVVSNSLGITQALSWIYVFIGISVVLVMSCYQTKIAKRYILIFVIWGVFAFQLGLRGEVMFPGVVALCLMFRQRRTPSGAMFFLILVGFLIAAGVVRNSRVSGDYREILYSNPFNAVAEMGASLRSVYETVRWRENGDDFILGQSYWAPFERQLALIIPGVDRLPALEDERLLNVVIQERAGPFGYSPVAEAYRNFGVFGVAFVCLILGGLIAWLDQLPLTMRNNMYIGAILVPLFIHIRNSFGPVPVQVFISLSVCWAAIAISKVRIQR